MRRLRFFFLSALCTALAGQAQTSNPQPAAPSAQPSSRSPEVPAAANGPTAAAPAQPVLDAESLIGKSDWKAAAAKLTAWLSENPTDARALFDSGYCADAQNRLDEAVALYRRAIEADPKSLESHLSLGLLLARQGKPSEARPELAAATELDPGPAGPALKARAWRALAQIDRTGNATEASSDLLEALKLSPETPADTLLAADLAEATGQYENAEAAYRRLLVKDPNSATANAGIAHLLIDQKKYPEAETQLRLALGKSPDDPALNAQLATVLAAQDKAEALPLLQKLHDARPDDASLTRMLADVLSTAGDYAGSDRLYEPLIAAYPGDAGLLIAHGQNLIRQIKNAEAFAVFSKATELDPANADGWSGLAFAASTTHNPSTALHALTMRSKYLPDIPSTYFLWATSYDSLHDKPAAITYYHHFLEAAAGKYPNQEWQARQRLIALEKK